MGRHSPSDPIREAGHSHGHSHAHGHSHGGSDRDTFFPRFQREDWTVPRSILALVLVIGALATFISMAVLWPGQAPAPEATDDAAAAGSSVGGQVLGGEHADATVTNVLPGDCNATQLFGRVYDTPPSTPAAPVDQGCTHVYAEITSGVDEGRYTIVGLSGGPSDPELSTGDDIVLNMVSDDTGAYSYSFRDMQRSTAVWMWVLAALVGIVIVGAWRGVRALIGLAITLGVIGYFLIPALAGGGPPLALAVTTCAAVLYLVLYVVHGLNWKTSSSLCGTLIAVLIGTGLAMWGLDSTDLRGLGDENNLRVLLYMPEVPITGLIIAGFTIGTLGVLNDVTVAQASTISELGELDRDAGPMRLFAGAMRVGRDHIASTLYTLVLTYTGAALPLLVLLSTSEDGIGDIMASDAIATEILRSATGSLALVAAVPLTTLIAALTIKRENTPANT